MKQHIIQFLLAIVMYVVVSLLTVMVIKPFSMLIFIGSAAGISSAIILLWGTHLLVAIVAGSIILNVILSHYFSVTFDLAIFIISTLAICLQGFWVKRLTYKVISTQKWLDSRIMLIHFILKIGPLASLVSASVSVLISVLYFKEFDTNLFYVFCRTWSASTLISIFAIPILLFVQGKQQLNSGKRAFVIVSSLLGGISIALLFKVFQDQHQHYRLDKFHKASDYIKSELVGEIENIEQNLNAINAYFETNDSVTLEEFNEFLAYILGDSSSVNAVEWVPVVNHALRGDYEEHVSTLLDFDYQISELTLSGNKVPHQIVDVYLPVQYVFPRYQNEDALSINLYQDINRKQTIDKATLTGKPAATIPLNSLKGDYVGPVINIVYPIFNQHRDTSFGHIGVNDGKRVIGFVVGVVKVSTLFNKITPYIEDNNINVSIKGKENGVSFSVYGQDINNVNRLVEQSVINVFSREWEYSISESSPWVLQAQKWQTWAMLFGGTFGGLIFQVLILMMAAYSSELSYRVSNQTRDLILAKEKSDNENQAKTRFLRSLSTELRTPLSVISKLVEVFPTKNLNSNEKEYIENISNASLNLEQLIDTLSELSTIESGDLVLNKQSFDFILFLNRMEDIVEAQNKNIQFIIQKDVPQFVKTDELRLQQVFTSCVDNACDLLTNSALSISVKVHFHQKNSATIVFVITSSDAAYNSLLSQGTFPSDFPENLRMAMAKELCSQLDGNIHLAKLPSGQMIMNVSIKVDVALNQDYEFARFNQLELNEKNEMPTLKHVLFVETNTEGNINFCRQLRALDFQLDIKKFGEPLNVSLFSQRYYLVVYDCSYVENSLNEVAVLADDYLSGVPTLGILNQPVKDEELTLVNNKFTTYVVLPIATNKLKNLLNKYTS
jgi:signal transduction histidine kinase